MQGQVQELSGVYPLICHLQGLVIQDFFINCHVRPSLAHLSGDFLSGCLWMSRFSIILILLCLQDVITSCWHELVYTGNILDSVFFEQQKQILKVTSIKKGKYKKLAPQLSRQVMASWDPTMTLKAN
jgi:hypothetical protein